MIHLTFFKHIFKMQLKATFYVSIAVFCLIFLFDFAEMARKYPIASLLETVYVIQLSLLKSPSTFCEILHYVYFITATFSLWNLCSSHQITVLKSTGQSPRQILQPFISFAIFLSIVWLTVIHPLGLIANRSYETITARSSQINNNIWIDSTTTDQIIFIKNIQDNTMNDLCVFNTTNQNRMFAKSATIENNMWTLNDVTTITDNTSQYQQHAVMRTNRVLSTELLNILSRVPTKQNIYSLYNAYNIEKSHGVSLRLYKLALHKLLANCVTFILFALIAAIICFPINRYKTKTNIAIKVISASIVLRFCNNMFESFAYTGVVPVEIASWAVVLASICLSIAVLIWKEA